MAPASQFDSLDPAFEKIPFNQWLGERDQTHLHWSVDVPRATLSFHQRLVSQVDIGLDGRDLESRRGEGRLVFFVQITNRDGTRYQNHNSLELGKLDENIKAANIQCSQPAFFLPGDYQLAVAILDTHSGEHSASQSHFKVPTPLSDFLVEAWRGLPSVEFIDNQPSPESWYMPDVRGRLQWATSVHSNVRLNVLLTVAPSVSVPGSRPVPSGGLAALLPTLKAISETGSSSLSERVQLLDLARRKAVYKQDNVQALDWPGLKIALSQADTSSIDLHSLSDRHHDAQFFVSEVRNTLRSSEKAGVLVILAAPVAFEPGEDLTPISLEALPASRVFYILYREPVRTAGNLDPGMGRGRGRGSRMGSPMGRGLPAPIVVDQLAGTLKPLNPKIFDVENPEQMTKALVEIEKALVRSQ